MCIRDRIKKVVEEIIERLRPPMTTALTGARQRHRRSPHASSRTFDWRGPIAANLANVDPATGRMRVEQVRFVARQRLSGHPSLVVWFTGLSGDVYKRQDQEGD